MDVKTVVLFFFLLVCCAPAQNPSVVKTDSHNPLYNTYIQAFLKMSSAYIFYNNNLYQITCREFNNENLEIRAQSKQFEEILLKGKTFQNLFTGEMGNSPIELSFHRNGGGAVRDSSLMIIPGEEVLIKDFLFKLKMSGARSTIHKLLSYQENIEDFQGTIIWYSYNYGTRLILTLILSESPNLILQLQLEKEINGNWNGEILEHKFQKRNPNLKA